MQQPDSPTYGLEVLNRFDILTRETFLARTGKKAPLFDPAKPVKQWFDTTAVGKLPSEPVEYKKLVNGAYVGYSMSAAAALSVNIPGKDAYAEYVNEPTATVIANSNGGSAPVNPVILSTFEQAQRLVAITGGQVSEAQLGGPFQYSYPETEKRRVYQITLPSGTPINVGLMVAAENANGVGAPGKWTKVTDGWSFVFTPQYEVPLGAKYTSMPVRDLLPNEIFEVVYSGTIPSTVIRRTDIADPTDKGIFTNADRAMLTKLYQKLS